MSTIVKKIVYTALATTLFGVLPLNAETIPKRGPAPFSSYDANKNGVITQKEFNNFRAHRLRERAELGLPMRNAANAPKFGFFDVNGDGKITKKEFAKARKERMQQRIQQRDDYGMGIGKGMGRGSMGNKTGMGKGQNR